MEIITETTTNLISPGTRIEGKITLTHISRIHGTLVGDIQATPGSTVILCENGVIEGSINADTLIIDGFVKGDISATSRVVVSGTGRVLGNIKAPSLSIDFGAHFEGRSLMEQKNT